MNSDYIRLPPHSIESEQSVLGGLLLQNEAMDRIIGQIGEQDFYRADHRVIWRAIVAMIDGDKPADVITVAEALDASNRLDEVGGFAYIASLAQNTPSAANIRHYAGIVREKAIRRNLIEAVTAIAEEAESGETAEVLASAQERIMAIGERSDTRAPVRVSTVAVERINALDEIYSGNDEGLSTGLTDLDEKLGKVRPGDILIVAGRPGMGKSAFAMQLAEAMSTEAKPGLFFSLEMSSGQLVDRIMSGAGKVNLKKFRSAQFTEEDWHGLTTAVGKAQQMPVFIDDHSHTLGQILSTMRAFKRRNGLGVVVLDYIGLVTADADSREQEIAKITRTLKRSAKQLGCPIIALSQLNRKLEDRADKRPQQADLRESGAVEQDADAILMLYRDEVYNPDSPHKGICEVIVRKNRHGETGTVPTVFRADVVRFENYAGTYDAQQGAQRQKYRKDNGL